MKVICVLLTLSISFSSMGSFLSLEKLTSELNIQLTTIADLNDDKTKRLHSDSIKLLLDAELKNPAMFNYDFNAVEKMAILKPEDQSFMLFNWNIPLSQGVNEFFCYAILPNDESNTVIEFEQPTRPLKKMETRTLDVDDWYGALYYDIIPVKKGKQTTYTLLGYSPSKKNITTKYVDVLTIKNGQLRLGAPVFKTKKGVKKRLIFQFSSEVSMTIRYQEKMDRIVVDHLAPRNPSMAGNFQFYGPDGSFDAYVLVKGNWELQENVDFRSDTKSKKPFKDPRLPENR